MKKIIVTIICLYFILGIGIKAQNAGEILTLISKNNKDIKANEKYFQALILEYKTNLNPTDPALEYGYYPGNSVAPGAKRTLILNQSFDFPTSYFHKRKYADKQIQIAEYRLMELRQKILLEAKSVYFDLVYLSKNSRELQKRVDHADDLYYSINKKFENGESTILDLNKAKIEKLRAENEFLLNNSFINQHIEKMVELNGGLDIDLNIREYFPAGLRDIQQIIREALEKDPSFLAVKMEKNAAERNISVQKSLNLPGLEIGYGSESVVNESFRGAKLGMTIPLWEKKNTVKHAKRFADYADQKVESYTNGFVSGIKQQYLTTEGLKQALDQYRQLISELKSEDLLAKALNFGQISLIEYLLELRYYYDTVDDLLKLEWDYFKALAILYKYQL